MKRKFTVTILIAVLALAAVFVTACGGKESGVTLVDFPATATEEAQKLGSVYQLRRTVSDEDGNEYNLTAEVKTSAGAVVSDVINASFELTDIGGYTITYTVTVAEGDVRTSVVTVPCYDDTPPVINIGTAADGVVGELYTLPAITFSDLDAVSERSVTVYLVAADGGLTEVKGLTETEGTYTFTPTAAGTYRISAYAKDSSGNEVTRTSDFIVDILLEGEVFNPEYSGARDQLSTDKDPNTNIEFVPAEDNDDETYGGAYWLVEPTDTGWVNTYLEPRLDVSEYAKYDVITFWIYVESTSTPGTFKMAMFNDNECAQTVMTQEWVCLEIDVDKFIEKVESQYFYAISYGGITGARIGEIMGRYNASFEVTEPEVGTITGQPAEVTFSVTETPEGLPYNVTVTNDETGAVVDTFTANAGSYTYSIATPGDYTLSVSPSEAVYYGGATRNFTVLNDMRIEVEDDYPTVVEANVPMDLYGAQVISSGSPTPDEVVRKIYSYVDDEWVDVTADAEGDVYTPEAVGRIKVEYTFGELDAVTYEIAVAGRGEIFDPAYEDARSQLVLSQKAAVPTFVPDAENEDTTYGGAYWNIAYSGDWCNVNLLPRLDWSEYEKYDVITFWVYVGYESDARFDVAMFNDGTHVQNVRTNTWTLCEVDIDKFISNANSQYFCAHNFRSGTHTLRIGEIVAKTAAEVSVEVSAGMVAAGGSADVTLTVTTTPADLPFAVTVTDPSGAAVATTVENNAVSFETETTGVYTYAVVSDSAEYYGTAEGSFNVYPSNIILLDGDADYAGATEVGQPFTLLDATAYVEGTGTADPERKLFIKTAADGDWTDITDSVQDNAYTPATAGVQLKVTYTYTGLEDLEYIVNVALPNEVFNPAAVYAGDRIATSGDKPDHAFIGTVRTFVSDADNTDETYGGAYVQFTIPGTGWADVSITPTFDVSYYAEYDYITVWLYIGQKAGETDGVVALPFGNSNYHKRKIMTGEWTRIVLVKGYDGMTGTTADNVFHTGYVSGNSTASDSFNFAKFLTASWAAQTAFVRVGEITGHTFDESNESTVTVFDPSADNVAASVGQNVTSGTINTTDAVNPAPEGGYSGAVVQWTPPASGWANFYLRPTTGVPADYAGYARLKVWMYIDTTAGTPADFEFLMYNDARARQKVKTDTWVEVTLDAGLYFDYVQSKGNGNSGNPYFISQTGWNGASVYFGTMTAVTYTEKA